MSQQDKPVAGQGWIAQIQEHGQVFGYSQVKAIELEEAWWVVLGMRSIPSEWKEF